MQYLEGEKIIKIGPLPGIPAQDCTSPRSECLQISPWRIIPKQERRGVGWLILVAETPDSGIKGSLNLESV